MEAKKQLELVRRSLAHVATRNTDRDPKPTTVAVQTYLDERRYAREREVLFRRSPVAVAHVSQLVSPGDFVTHDGTGIPLLVVRGDDGSLSAFINVCRHRGNCVEKSPCGRDKKAFVCGYHAWTYGRDGRLKAIPSENGFEGVDRDARASFASRSERQAAWCGLAHRPAARPRTRASMPLLSSARSRRSW